MASEMAVILAIEVEKLLVLNALGAACLRRRALKLERVRTVDMTVMWKVDIALFSQMVLDES
jgi:hypothetical protein